MKRILLILLALYAPLCAAQIRMVSSAPAEDTVVTYYVDKATGSNSNNSGRTAAAPFSTIAWALAKSDVERVIIRPGVYRENIVVTRDVELISGLPQTSSETNWVGVVDVRGSNLLTGWTLHAGTTYKASLASTVHNVWLSDVLDGNGDWTNLTHQTSIANVEANAGSWYQTAGVVYVRMPDDSDPSLVDVEAVVRNLGVEIKAPSSVYVRGITFSGFMTYGIQAYQVASAENAQTLRFEQTASRYNGSATLGYGMGWRISGPIVSTCRQCRAFKNMTDGFNFHQGGLHDLIDCYGYRNGDNGASPHEGAYMNVVGGRYHDNTDQNLVAVQDSTMNLDGVITTGSGTSGIHYDDSEGRIVNSYSGENVTGLTLVGSKVLLVNVTYGTNSSANESVDGTSTKYGS